MRYEEMVQSHLRGVELTEKQKRQMIKSVKDTAWIVQWNAKGIRIVYTCCGKTDSSHKGEMKTLPDVEHQKIGKCPFCGAQVRYIDCNHVKHSDISEKYHVFFRRSRKDKNAIVLIGAWVGMTLYQMKGVEPAEREGIIKLMQPGICVCEAAVFSFGKGTESWSRELPEVWSTWKHRYAPNWRQFCAWVPRKHPDRREHIAGDWRTSNFDTILHREELEAVIAGTRWERICRELNVTGERFPAKALETIARRPQLQYMLTGGLKKLAENTVDFGGCKAINWKAKSQRKLLTMLDSNELARLKAMPPERVSETGLLLMRAAQKNGKPLKLEEAFALASRVPPISQRELSVLGGQTVGRWGVGRVLRYVIRQRDAGVYGALNMWIDHIKTLELLGEEKTESVVFPQNLRLAHAEHGARLKIKKDENINEQIKKQAERLAEKFSFAACGLIMRPYESAEEIIKDGVALDICVHYAGYMKKHAEGKTVLTRLYRESAPDEPFHCCEFTTDGKLVQCRGYKNATFEEDEQQVRDFWAAWSKAKKKTVDPMLTIAKRRETRTA